MKRYYINRRIGTGASRDPYRSELRVFVYATFGIKHLKQVIAHTFPWVLMKYDLTGAQHTLVMDTVPQVFAFPSGALDREVSTLSAPIRQAIRDMLDTIELDQGWVTGTTRIRGILRYIALTIQLSEWVGTQASALQLDARMTIGDLTPHGRARLNQHLQDLGVSPDDLTLQTSLADVIQRVEFTQDGQTPRLYRGRRWFFHDDEDE